LAAHGALRQIDPLGNIERQLPILTAQLPPRFRLASPKAR
jgi:hypothetical protein